MTTNTGGPAFPAPAGVQHITDQGMTLRDYFAAKAMQALLSQNFGGAMSDELLAGMAYAMADAMLKAREQ